MLEAGLSALRGARFGLLVTGAALVLTATTAKAQSQRMRVEGPVVANPSAVVAAELGLARLAQEKGQWTALREATEKDAVMFRPGAVNAPGWLSKQANPAAPMRWQPHRIFMACDGSYALATGPWQQADGTSGSFATIWRQQKNGSYKWVLDFLSKTPAPANEEGAIEARVADCARRGSLSNSRRDRPKYQVVRIANPPPASGTGQSLDGSLRWTWSEAAGGPNIEVMMRYQGAEVSVFRDNDGVTAP